MFYTSCWEGQRPIAGWHTGWWAVHRIVLRRHRIASCRIAMEPLSVVRVLLVCIDAQSGKLILYARSAQWWTVG